MVHKLNKYGYDNGASFVGENKIGNMDGVLGCRGRAEGRHVAQAPAKPGKHVQAPGYHPRNAARKANGGACGGDTQLALQT